MRSIVMWAVIFTCIWAPARAMPQKDCFDDADCMGNQYCYQISKLCVNYTICRIYNRQNASTPAREASQCGDCLSGFVAGEIPDNEETGNRAESCIEDRNAGEQTTHNISIWVGGTICTGILVLAIVYIIHAMVRCKSPCPWQFHSQPEQPISLLPIRNGAKASAPPAPSNQNMNNNKYDAEEMNPLANTVREYCNNFAVDTSRPVKARPFCPPNWVDSDPNYNPVNPQTSIAITISSPDIDEETIPSSWAPSPQNGGIPAQPFAAVSQAVQDNATNNALQRLTCPSPSTTQGGHESRQNNNSSGSSGGFANNQRSGNSVGIHVTQQVQILNHSNSRG